MHLLERAGQPLYKQHIAVNIYVVAAGLICLLAPWCQRWALRGDASVARERVIAMGVDRVLQAHVRLQLASAALREADPAPT